MTATTESSGRTSKFWDKIANSYSKRPISDEAAYQKKIRVTQSYFNTNMEVLEIGCGTGGASIIHAPFVKHIIATDISSKMIEIAKQKAAESKVENVQFKVATVDEVLLPDNSLDAVLGLGILHLLENKEEVFSRTYKMLKPGGIFVTSTPCVEDMSTTSQSLVKFFFPVGRFFGFMPPYFSSFSLAELKENFREAGFSIDYEWKPENEAGKPKNEAAVFIIGKKPV